MVILGKIFLTGFILFVWGFIGNLFVNNDEYQKADDDVKIFFAVTIILPLLLGLLICLVSGIIIVWVG